jgi:hypothetical protein
MLEVWGSVIRFLAGEQIISAPEFQNVFGAYPDSYLVGTEDYFTRSKAAEVCR